MSWGRRNADWAAVYGINSQLESQKTELHHAHQWACQTQMESRIMFEELTTKSKLYQENHALDCMEIEELRRLCREETERARQLRADDFYCQKKEEPSTVNQLLSQTRTLQDKVNALNAEKEFHDPETASSSGTSPRTQSTLEKSESNRYSQPRFWIAALFTEFDGYFRKCF